MGQHELLLYGKILLPALALLVILFIIGKVRSIRRNKQIEEQFSEKEAAQTKKPVNSCGASSKLNSAQIESINRKLQKQYDSKRNPGKLILLLIIGVIVCLFIASKTEFYILIPIFLVAFFVILIVYSIVSALLYRRNKVNNFYSELLPNVLADAFADYKPQMMQKPSMEFFEAPIAYNLLSPMTYGVLTFENSSFLSTAFFCVSREYNPPRSAGETDPRFRESYTINQGITFNITPKNSFSPNCKIFIKSKAQQESVIISAAEMTSPPLLVHKGIEQLASTAIRDTSEMKELQTAGAEFSKYFCVSSNDELASNRFLTPALMQQITELRKYAGPMHLYYAPDKITVSFSDFRMMDTYDCTGSGIPSGLSEYTIAQCREKLDALIENLTSLLT